MKRTQADWERLATTFDRETLDAMRDWVLDCAVNHDDAEDRETAPDWQIVKYVYRQYAGGIAQFLVDSTPIVLIPV